MNSPEELRRLIADGYTLLSERAVCDAGRVYTVMEILALPDDGERGLEFLYTGLLNPEKECDRLFLEKQYTRLSECAAPLAECPREREKYLSLVSAAEVISRRINEG